MHKSATKCNETIGKWYKNKHGASKIIDTLETYHGDALSDQKLMMRSVGVGHEAWNKKYLVILKSKDFEYN
jgi:hypothetical protein